MTKLNWRDASKELPDDKPVLAIDDCGNFYITVYCHEYGEWVASNFITYWLPLNEIPLPEGVL